jgi:hypothetical protein
MPLPIIFSSLMTNTALTQDFFGPQELSILGEIDAGEKLPKMANFPPLKLDYSASDNFLNKLR